MVLVNGWKCGTPEASYMMKNTSTSFGKFKTNAKKHLQYKEGTF